MPVQEIIRLVLPPAAVAFLTAAAITPIVIRLASRLKILDTPGKRRHPATIHSQPIPRGGGISIFAAILVGAYVFLPHTPRISAILVGGVIIAVLGFLDDRKDINPYLRLAGQLLAALVVAGSGIGIAFISNPFAPGVIDLSNPRFTLDFLGETREIWILSAAFATLWIVGLMNAVSWSSGVDGQLSGFVAIAALVITALSLRFWQDTTQWPVIILAAITFGAFAGFLPWHIYPQRIMPGFGGATLAGFMLAVLSILATAKVGTLLVVLAIPVTDAAYIVARRVLAGKSPVWGDRGHLHHRLLDMGWARQKIAYFYWAMTAVLGILALYLNAKQKFYTMIGIVLLVGFFFLCLNFWSASSKRQDRGNG